CSSDLGLGELGELRGLLRVEVRIVRDVAVRADQQVARIVRIEVEHREDPFAAGDDELVLAVPRVEAERAAAGLVVALSGPVLAGDVGHPVRCPEPLQSVGGAGLGELRSHADDPTVTTPRPRVLTTGAWPRGQAANG